MKLTNLLSDSDDSRAVSPVIGVILMVAITVILAAVIGTFVLGLGDSVESAPQASITFDGDGSSLEITHRGGDGFDNDELELRGSGVSDPPISFTDSEVTTSGSEFSAGNTVTLDSGLESDGGEINVVYTGGDSDTVIASYDMPAE